jgi:hypothetical protein
VLQQSPAVAAVVDVLSMLHALSVFSLGMCCRLQPATQRKSSSQQLLLLLPPL